MSTSHQGVLNSYLPCHYKSSFETTAKQQLLNISNRQHGHSGDSTRRFCRGKTESHSLPQSQTMGKVAKSYNDLDTVKKLESGRQENCKGEGREINENESGDCRLSMFDVFLKLSSRDMEFGFGRGFGCWNTCSQGHINSVLHNLKDPPKEPPYIQLQKPSSARSHKERTIISATGRLHEVESTISTVPKRRTACKSAKSTTTSRPSSRASSAMDDKDSTGWSDSPPIPIDYKFKHSRHSKQHADRYRELYTYAKMRERHNLRKSGMVIPRARLVCIDAQESGFRGMALGGKSASTTATSDYDYYVPDVGMKGGVKWYMQRLHESCDPKLSVNNPSPTEIAMFCKVPAVKRSSPSIPSNTNGKYGGKGTDKPYPFQLNISAANKTVRTPVKRPVRTFVTKATA